MSLNPYEPPRTTDLATDHDRAATSKASIGETSFTRRVTLVIGGIAAPLLALMTTVLAFALLVTIESQLGLDVGAPGIVSKLITLCVPPLIGFFTLKQVAGWLHAPELWELVSVTIWIGLTVATVVGCSQPR